jgi:hypothetical protein
MTSGNAESETVPPDHQVSARRGQLQIALLAQPNRDLRGQKRDKIEVQDG